MFDVRLSKTNLFALIVLIETSTGMHFPVLRSFRSNNSFPWLSCTRKELYEKKCTPSSSSFPSFSVPTKFYIHMEWFFSSLLLSSNNSSNPHHTIIKKKTFFRRIFFLLHDSFDFFSWFQFKRKEKYHREKILFLNTFFLFRSAVFVFHLALIVFCSKTELFCAYLIFLMIQKHEWI